MNSFKGDSGRLFLYSKENTQTACVYHFPDVRKMTSKPPTLLSLIFKETIKAINHEMVDNTRH